MTEPLGETSKLLIKRLIAFISIELISILKLVFKKIKAFLAKSFYLNFVNKVRYIFSRKDMIRKIYLLLKMFLIILLW